MATLRKRRRKDGSTTYQVRWRDPDAGETSETFSTEKSAIKFRGLVDANGQRTPAGWVPGHGFSTTDTGTLTVGTWCRRAVAAQTGIEERTRHDYLALLDLHLGALEDIALRDLTREDVGVWVASLRRSPKTVKNIHGLLSQCLTAAAHDGHLTRNPAEGLRLPRRDGPDTKEIVPLSSSDVALLVASADEHYRPLLQTLADTGMRWSEATGLTASHINPFSCKVTIAQAWKRQPDSSMKLGTTKTRRSKRTIGIPESLRDQLIPLLSDLDASGLLFTTPKGTPIRNSNFRDRVWIPAIVKAQRCEAHADADEPCGCEGTLRVTPRIHDLRHAHASALIAAGVPLVKIQRRLGHESIQTTVDTYGHLMPDSDDEVIAAINAAAHTVRRAATSRK